MILNDEKKEKFFNILIEIKSSFSFSSAKLYLLLLLIMYIPIFLVFQNYYVIDNQNSLLSTQIIAFLGSDAFKWVTTVLLVPILSLFIDNTFKVRERIDAQLEKRKEEKKQFQLDCLNNTQAVWRDILGLCGELKFYDLEKRNISNIRLDLVKSRNTAIEVTNMWNYYFPKLHEYDKHYRRLLLIPFDILLNSANSVAQYIQDNQGSPYIKNDEIVDYQCALSTIENNMDYFFQDSIINIFRSYMNLEHENDIGAKKMLNDNLSTIRELSYELKEKELENDDIFSFVKDKLDKDKIENISDKYEQWCKCNPTEKPNKCYLIKDFNKTFDQIANKRKYTTKIPYSLDCMNALAKYLDSKRASSELRHRALWKIRYYLENSDDNNH
ncbi:hypothetical protein [Methanobacterium sp.]|uniref:hypothetical protein n=1 Tax=Methanobacterium sp. TaxID=2164 RepID=UPI00315829FA